MPSPSIGGVQWRRLIRNQGCGPTLPDSLSTMPLSFEKKREREGDRGKGVGKKEGADSYVYADMYFKASISPTLRRFVIGVGCILRYFRFTMASLPPYLIPGGRRSNESPKHCVESIPTPTFSYSFSKQRIVTGFETDESRSIFEGRTNFRNEKSREILTLRYLDCNLRSQTFSLFLSLSFSLSFYRETKVASRSEILETWHQTYSNTR